MSRYRHIHASSIEANHIYDQYIQYTCNIDMYILDIQFAVIVLGEALDQGCPTQLHHGANIFVSILKKAAQ